MTNHIAYRLHPVLAFVALAVTIFIVSSCSGNPKVAGLLSAAENLIEQSPDSAFKLLKEIDGSSLNSKEEKARYALLMSMVLDKNFIDTTSFDVLQPAIDYYLENGSPDEKLKTYYYQGRIYQNRGDLDNALNSFVKGFDGSLNYTDSLTIVRTLVAQAHLYCEFYDFDSYANLNLRAASICKALSHKDYEFNCLLNALNGAIILDNRNMADSVINICNTFKHLNDTQNKSLLGHRLSYALKFGVKQDLDSILIHKNEILELDINGVLNLALAYNKLGDNYMSKQLLDYVNNQNINYDTLKYQSIYISVLKDIGNYKEALSEYENFSHRVDALNSIKFDQKARSINEKHKIELKAQYDSREKSKIIWGCIGGIVVLLMSIFILLLWTHGNKVQKDLAIEKAKNTELENKQLKQDNEMAMQRAKIVELENERLKSDNEMAMQRAKIVELENERLKSDNEMAMQRTKIVELENERLKSDNEMAMQKAKIIELENKNLRSERENLALENKNLQLERDKKALEADNLSHRVETLENESESLKNILKDKEELPPEVQKAIQVRIEMLNALIAAYITENEEYEKTYDTWLKELTQNSDEFMNSNRLAYQVSHPHFIQYFENHGLTESEINYVCLYAIGLKGKDVGNYMKRRSHVNMSSAIRKKLGIDKHETNIGIYVRKLYNNL